VLMNYDTVHFCDAKEVPLDSIIIAIEAFHSQILTETNFGIQNCNLNTANSNVPFYTSRAFRYQRKNK
jgi:hypothetical protein